MFYGLCLLISEIRDVVGVAHVLCGTNLELTEETVKKYSPAQGMTRYISIATSLDARQIKAWFSRHLTKKARNGLTDALINKLRGRPIFASLFCYCLLAPGIVKSTPDTKRSKERR